MNAKNDLDLEEDDVGRAAAEFAMIFSKLLLFVQDTWRL